MSLTDQDHLDLTSDFIAVNPVTVELFRQVRTPDGKGGQTTTPTSQGNVTGRLVGKSGQQDKRTDPQGNVVSPEHTFVLPAGTDVQEGDYFDIGSDRHTVVFIRLSPPWRVQADVKRSAV